MSPDDPRRLGPFRSKNTPPPLTEEDIRRAEARKKVEEILEQRRLEKETSL